MYSRSLCNTDTLCLYSTARYAVQPEEEEGSLAAAAEYDIEEEEIWYNRVWDELVSHYRPYTEEEDDCPAGAGSASYT